MSVVWFGGRSSLQRGRSTRVWITMESLRDVPRLGQHRNSCCGAWGPLGCCPRALVGLSSAVGRAASPAAVGAAGSCGRSHHQSVGVRRSLAADVGAVGAQLGLAGGLGCSGATERLGQAADARMELGSGNVSQKGSLQSPGWAAGPRWEPCRAFVGCGFRWWELGGSLVLAMRLSAFV